MLVISAFSVHVLLDQLSDLTVSQFPCEGMRERTNSFLVRRRDCEAKEQNIEAFDS